MTNTAKVLEWQDLDFPHRVALKNICESSFLGFTRVFFELLQGEKMIVNWHHRYMSDAVEQVIKNKLKPGNLIINVPPGGTKSEFFSIHLPAYQNMLVNIQDLNKFRNLNISFSDTLVKRNSRRTRDIIQSAEYQELWPCEFGVNQAEEWEILRNGKTAGQTISRSAGGQITGARGGFFGDLYSGHIMLDDYNKPDDMFSETKRDAANRKMVNTIRSRRGDKSKEHPTPVIGIQQRLHVNDMTGFCDTGGMGMDFKIISIPALIDREYIDSLPEPFKEMCLKDIEGTDSRIIGGVEYWSYWPEMEHIDDLVSLWERDEYTFLSQYMQKPKALTGGLVDTDWFGRYEMLPELEWMAVYVDTNSGKVQDHNDFTVFTLAGYAQGRCYIIDVVRGKWDPEELLEMAIAVWDKWSEYSHRHPVAIRYMAIEDKQAGQGLITTLKKRRSIPVKEIPRGNNQNKLIRCNNVIPHIKTGNVCIPLYIDDNGRMITETRYATGEVSGSTDWMPAALKEVADFSADDSHDNDDIFDTWMDAIDDMLITQDQQAQGVFVSKKRR